MTKELMNQAFEKKWKNYLENNKLPNDAWVKEVARNFFMREVEEKIIFERLIFVLSEKKGNHKSYFYYPSTSCKTKDGEIKMLIKQLNKSNNFERDYALDLKLRSN